MVILSMVTLVVMGIGTIIVMAGEPATTRRFGDAFDDVLVNVAVLEHRINFSIGITEVLIDDMVFASNKADSGLAIVCRN